MSSGCGRWLAFVLALVGGSSLTVVGASTCPGCVDLDEVNFDKTIQRFPYALVKFDIAFPFGEKHEAFAAFSRAAHALTDDLLVATVGIKDYGEYENKKLGDRFKVNDKKYPGIFLFRHGLDDYVSWPSHLDVTLDNLKTFVSSNTDLYIGREGCLKEFNDLVTNFANLEDEKQTLRYQEAQKMAEQLTKPEEEQSAKIYLIFMKKIQENGYQFVEDETKRLSRLRAGQISEAKKSEIYIKLNILESFRVPRPTTTTTTADPNKVDL